MIVFCIYKQQVCVCICHSLPLFYFDCLLFLGSASFALPLCFALLCHLSLLRLLLCVSCQVLDIIYDLVLCPDCETPDKKKKIYICHKYKICGLSSSLTSKCVTQGSLFTFSSRCIFISQTFMFWTLRTSILGDILGWRRGSCWVQSETAWWLKCRWEDRLRPARMSAW